jgi:hypothetical protein
MKALFKISLPCALALHLLTLNLRSQTPPAIPGLPEPGLVVWGTVVNASTNQPITLTSASWTVAQSSPTKSATYNDATKPSVRIFSQGGQSYYVVEVPFDTRLLGSVSLADPAAATVSEAERLNSFELKVTSPPNYTLTPTINGVLATVKAIDSAPASVDTVPVSGFNTSVRGRVIRVDLAITPLTESYELWATRYFGGITGNGARTADPDSDNSTNEQEYVAGTQPDNAASILRILSIARDVSSRQVTVGWQSVTAKIYEIETSTTPGGPWQLAAGDIPSQGVATAARISADPSDPSRYYRVITVQP